tara:strand:+ start:8122 stop:8373 length:252 start_codon:yes stop_codon:yes gene_type:complete
MKEDKLARLVKEYFNDELECAKGARLVKLECAKGDPWDEKKVIIDDANFKRDVYIDAIEMLIADIDSIQRCEEDYEYVTGDRR